MNILRLSIVALLLSVSCTSIQSTREPVVYNPRVSEETGSYLRLFRAEADKRNVTFSYEGLQVYFVDKFRSDLENEGVIGLCSFSADKKIVMLRRPSWDSYDSLQREMLIFHELAHCVLDQDHDESTDFESVPVDLMYPSNFPSVYYARKRSDYLDRMFKKFKEEKSQPTSIMSTRRHVCTWGKTYLPEKNNLHFKRGHNAGH